MTEIADTVYCCRLKNPVFQALDLPPSSGGMGKGENLPCNNCLQSQGQTIDLSDWHWRWGYSLSKIHWKMEVYRAFLLWVFGLTWWGMSKILITTMTMYHGHTRLKINEETWYTKLHERAKATKFRILTLHSGQHYYTIYQKRSQINSLQSGYL
jgi:hypothetical protein